MTNIDIGLKMCRNKKAFCTNLFMSDKTEFGLWMDRHINRVIVCFTVVAIAIPLVIKPQEGSTKRAWVSDEKVLQAIRDRNNFIAKNIESGEYDLSDVQNTAPSSSLSSYDMTIIELPRGYQKNQDLIGLVSEINESVEKIKSFESFKDASLAFTDAETQNQEHKAIANSKK